MGILVSSEVSDRVERLEIPFNRCGLDPFGVSRVHLKVFYSVLSWLYRHYFRVITEGIEHVPDRGRAILVGNHSGGLPVDGGMVLASLFLEKDPPRLAHSMVEKFAQHWPVLAPLFDRVGQFTGLPEHMVRLLEAERVILVFPEGARGTGKLIFDRYKLVRFGTGFMRLAMRTRSPIIPFAFIGGEEAIPTLFHFKLAARLTGAPYWPVPLQVLPFPLPSPCQIHYGEPMTFEGKGTESDDIVQGHVEQVRERIEALIAHGLRVRRGRLGLDRILPPPPPAEGRDRPDDRAREEGRSR